MSRLHAADPQQTTRTMIKRTFLSIYKTKPLNRIFVSDLAQACSISRGTFYFHYENIEQLYHECEQDLIAFMEFDLDKTVLSTVGSSRENMLLHIQTYSQHLSRYASHLDEFKCLLLGAERASFRFLWSQSVRRHFEQTLPFSRTIAPAFQEPLLEFFSGGTVQMLCNWILSDCTAPVEDIAKVHAQMLFQGAFLSHAQPN